MNKLPPWIDTAQKLMGTKEVPGSSDNPKIIAWAKVIGGDIEQSYVADSIPWCGLFVAYCMAENGIKPVSGALWALSWSKFGQKLDEAVFGCILTIKRTGGGHVCFVVGQDDDYYHCLGGNQSDQVNITRILKSQKVSLNWPKGFEEYKFILPEKTKFTGKISSVQQFS